MAGSRYGSACVQLATGGQVMFQSKAALRRMIEGHHCSTYMYC